MKSNQKVDNKLTQGGAYKGIDIGKFIMSLIVIAYHMRVYSGANEKINLIYETIRLVAVPFFFMASGFFLYKEEGIENRLKKTLKSIIKLYIIWQLIYLPFGLYDLIMQKRFIFSIIALCFRWFFLTGGSSYTFFLWYLLSFIYSLILLLIFMKKGLSEKKILIITFIIYLFGVTMNFLVFNYDQNYIIKIYKTIFANGDIFRGPLLLFLGIFINKHKINISRKEALLLILISFTISILLPNEITKLIFFVSVFLLALNSNNIKMDTTYFRKCSTIFYFIHILNVSLIIKFTGVENFSGVINFLIICLMCTIESIIILFIQNKWNFKFINELFNWSSTKKIKNNVEK